MKKAYLHIALIIVVLISSTTVYAQLLINEVSYVNEVPSEENFASIDWIEIYNPNDHSVMLHGWHLTDDSGNLTKYAFPDSVIAPYQHLLVCAAGQDAMASTHLAAPFQIANGEEHLFLMAPNGTISDALMAVSTLETGSYQRFPDGQETWYHTTQPTPQNPNRSESIVYPFEENLIAVSHESGLYHAPFELTALCPDPYISIHYTTNGEIPQVDSPVLLETLPIEREQKHYTGIAYKPSSDSWQTPIAGVSKYQVIRLRPFFNGIPIGNTQTYTYAIHEEIDKKFPTTVVSLVLADSLLFDDNIGIYVPGNSTYGNFAYKGKAWERAAHMSLINYDEGTLLTSDVRLRIHGRSSRFAPQKNLRVYGPEMFDDEAIQIPELRPTSSNDAYYNFILRAPEPLFSTSLFTNQLAQRIVRDLNFESPHNLSCVALINGYYWGIHHMEERIDKHFLSQHTSANTDEVDIIDWDRQLTVVEGNLDAYNQLMQYIQSHNLSNSSYYDEMGNMLDIPSFIDYISAQVFFANEDFAVNNVRLWKEHGEGSKWRFIFFDADATMRQHWQDRLTQLLGPSEKSDPVHVIFNALAQNESFIKQFYSRFIYLLNTVFTPNNLLHHLEAFVSEHKPLVAEHIRRWQRPESFTEWENAIAQIRQFMLLRPALMTDQLNQQFELPFTLFPNPCDNAATIWFHSNLDDQAQSLFHITVRSSSGQEVEVPLRYGTDRVHLETALLPSGVYIIEIRMPMMMYTHRMIVQH
jgi:hypothetical protein